MRKTLGVCFLTLLLTVSAAAGEIPNDKPVPPPEPTTYVQDSTDGVALQGEISTPDESESLAQIALGLLAVLPSIL